MNSGELESLFTRFRSEGDVDALAHVFDETAPELIRVASHLVRCPEDAEDLLQQTFVTAIERARTFDPDGSLVSWLVGILAKHARNAWRKSKASPRSDLEVEERQGLMSEVLDREERGAVEAALADLQEPYREVLIQHLLEGRGGTEIAKQLRRAPATIRSQIHRGIQLLRKALPKGLIAGGVVAITETKGLAGVRAEVLAHAVKPSTVVFGIGGLVMGKKVISVLALATLIVATIVWDPISLRSGGEDPIVPQTGSEPVAVVRVSTDLADATRELLPEPPDGRARLSTEAQGPATVRVTGRVIDDVTGMPVSGAAVWVGDETVREGSAPDGCSATGEDGRFEAEGRYWIERTLLVWSDDHALLREEFEMLPRPGEMVEIDVGVLRLVSGASVRGRVLTSEGVAVPDALLILHEYRSAPSFFPAWARRVGRTDRDGAFALAHVPPSRGPGHRLFAVCSEGIGVAEVAILMGQPATEPIELHLFSPASLKVSVLDSSGDPLPDALVEVIPISPPFMITDWSHEVLRDHEGFPGTMLQLGELPEIVSVFRRSTDFEGKSSFDRLPAPAPSCLRIRKSGYIEHLTQVQEYDADRTSEVRVELSAIVRRPVFGKVVTKSGMPVPGAVVRKFAQRPSRSWADADMEVATDFDGSFVIESQDSDSEIYLSVHKEGIARQSAIVHVSLEEDSEPVELVVERAVPVFGVVIDQHGVPIFGASATLARGSQWVYPEGNGTTSADGRFSFADATEGIWTLNVDLPAPGDQWEERSLKQPLTAGSSLVRVVAVRETPGLADVTVEAFDGKTDERLLPSRAWIARYGEDGQRPRRFDGGEFHADGHVEFSDVKTGRWCLMVECEGYPENYQDFKIDPGDTERLLRMAMRGPGRLRGRVLLGDQPMPERLLVWISVDGRAVDVSGKAVKRGPARIGKSLTFEFVDVQPGPVTVTLGGSNLISGNATVDVEHDAEASVEVHATQDGVLRTRGAGAYSGGQLMVSVTMANGSQGDLAQYVPAEELDDEKWKVSSGRLEYVIRGVARAGTQKLPVDQLSVVAEGELVVIPGEEVVLEIPPPRGR